MNAYIALIGDVINSKKIESKERLIFQENLKKDFKRFNDLYKEKIAAELTVTLEDEYQGLFYDANIAFEVITYLQVKYSFNFRYGIGIGKLYTNLNDISIGMDGPTWWKAREALDSLKKTKRKIQILGINNKNFEEIINNSLVFIWNKIGRWTREQKKVLEQIIYTYGLNNQFKQIEFANKYKIDPTKVSRMLKSTMYFDYVDVVKSISKIINSEVIFKE